MLSSSKVYSGQEHHYNGANDPYNREAIWFSRYDTNSLLYKHVAKLNKIRKHAISKSNYTAYWAITIYKDDHSLAIRKGYTGAQVVSVYNNNGASAGAYSLTIRGSDFVAGSTIIDVLSCAQVVVASDSSFQARVISGLPLVS